jgi:hypothetical protein
MGQHQEHVQNLEADRWHGEEVDRDQLLDVVVEKCPPRQVWLGGLRCRSIYLLTLVSPMSMPSLSSSPWMRGAPQSGLARLMLRIRSRTSCETVGLPVLPCRTFQVQNNRKPFRCQAMTVSGLTMTSADRQPAQTPDNHAQKKRSATVNLGRFLAERRSTPIWCRSARISTWRAARERKAENRVARNGIKVLNMGLARHSGTSSNPHDLREIEVCERHKGDFVRDNGLSKLAQWREPLCRPGSQPRQAAG